MSADEILKKTTEKIVLTGYHEDILEAIIERNYERTVSLFEELLEEVGAVLMGT